MSMLIMSLHFYCIFNTRLTLQKWEIKGSYQKPVDFSSDSFSTALFLFLFGVSTRDWEHTWWLTGFSERKLNNSSVWVATFQVQKQIPIILPLFYRSLDKRWTALLKLLRLNSTDISQHNRHKTFLCFCAFSAYQRQETDAAPAF